MHRCYVSKKWLDDFLQCQNVNLPPDVVTRFFSIVRVKPDEEIAVFDGEGREIIGTLKKTPAGAVLLLSKIRQEPPPTPEIILVQAAVELAKLEQTIQRGCEFGVDRFIIVESDRSEQYCLGKIEKKLDRLVRIAEDAARQSMRLYIPAIAVSLSLHDVMREVTKSKGFGLVGDVSPAQTLSHALRGHAHDAPIFIAVGPEGGFSPQEIKAFKEAGFLSVSWAPYVLRSELAGLAAVAIINAFLGRA